MPVVKERAAGMRAMMVRLWPDALDALFGAGTASRRVAGYTTRRRQCLVVAAGCHRAEQSVRGVLLDRRRGGNARATRREAILRLWGHVSARRRDANRQRRLVDALVSLATSVLCVTLPRGLVGETARLVAADLRKLPA